MKYFYQSGAMGYGGEGYFWHSFLSYDFPKFPIVTKTITLKPKIGLPFAVIPFGKSVWNRISWHNPGLFMWIVNHAKRNLIVSLGGTDDEIKEMIEIISFCNLYIKGIELNFSCPHENRNNKEIPNTYYKLYLKLRADQNPYDYDLDKIERIHLNTMPKFFGGVSGKITQEKNWKFIENYSKLPIAGCSFNSMNDIEVLEALGCEYTGIGSTIITNPKLVSQLKET
jgi:dihydroorotate dehydrogenase